MLRELRWSTRTLIIVIIVAVMSNLIVYAAASSEVLTVKQQDEHEIRRITSDVCAWTNVHVAALQGTAKTAALREDLASDIELQRQLACGSLP